MSRLRTALRLYLVMGSVNCRQSPLQVLEAAIAGGITCFQYREKGHNALSGQARHMLGKQLRTCCRKYSIPFIVNDDVQLALALEADGLHIGQEDGSPQAVRAQIGHQMWLGVSAHNLAEAQAAAEAGADYIGVGPIYPTASKDDAQPVVGPARIRELRAALPHMPIVGIGGIGPESAGAVIAAGADGVALISAISLADSPAAAAQDLRQVLGKLSSS